jgi:cellulose synthase/poly-beta-1,6-N-acetylglucosamine synthase-like glycosyltransferase
MNTVAIVLVLSPVLLGFYAYIVYPLLLLARGGSPPHVEASGDTPFVTIIVPAYNEEAQIRGAIEALIAQDYPADRRQILILSDGSTDRTDDIVREYAPRGVELVRVPQRSGKTAAENFALRHVKGEIVINSDASIRLHPSAVRLLVARFADPRVGVASTRDVSVARLGESANTTEAGYVGYEMWVRALETRAGGIVGASGSGYAIRAQLHHIPVRDDLSRDFSAALTAQLHGYRAVSVYDAVCYVPRTSSLRAEYRRKVRTISRGMETLIFHRRLLEPKHGLFAWKLLSHKISRWLVPITLIPCVIGLSMLARTHLWAAVLLGCGVTVGLIATLGAFWPQDRPMPRAISVLAFAAAANVAVVHAAWRVLHGHEDHLWEPTRRPPSGSEPERRAERSAESRSETNSSRAAPTELKLSQRPSGP